MERNTNEYTVLLFKTDEAFNSPKPQAVLTMSSNSNREAIKDVRWLDNETIGFIGENPGELSQVYEFNLRKRKLQPLTNHPTDVRFFDVTKGGDRLIYSAREKESEPAPKIMRREGIVVSNQLLPDLLAGHDTDHDWDPEELFLKKRGEKPARIVTDDEIVHWYRPFGLLSPMGKYAILPVRVRTLPENWKDYEDKDLQRLARAESMIRFKRASTFFYRCLLLDTTNGTIQPLLDAPVSMYTAGFAWAPDGHSVVLSGTYLPLGGSDSAELGIRKRNTFAVEVAIPSRKILKITDRDLTVVKWNGETGRLVFEPGHFKDGPNEFYEKKGDVWVKVSANPLDDSTNSRLDVIMEEDPNTPPKIYTILPATQQKALLLDLNPKFDQLAFGRVEHIAWSAANGSRAEGGLYFPPDYIPGRRYPIVIQTHGFKTNRFSIDGPFSTAFAAQPLASDGFLVLQAPDPDDSVLLTPEEPMRAMALYEGAIDYLDTRGLVDRKLVGIIGFSRTCFYVKYTLTHSTYPFAAATVADGVDMGYFEYLALANLEAEWDSEHETVNGGLPFGDQLSSWQKNAPGFGLGIVHTPVRIEAIGRSSVLLGWEWFVGLSRLSKPVDMILIPDGYHMLVKPWERMTSQQGNIDWFTFWLKGEEDPTAEKKEQYERWRGLKKIQEENDKKAKERQDKSEMRTPQGVN